MCTGLESSDCCATFVAQSTSNSLTLVLLHRQRTFAHFLLYQDSAMLIGAQISTIVALSPVMCSPWLVVPSVGSPRSNLLLLCRLSKLNIWLLLKRLRRHFGGVLSLRSLASLLSLLLSCSLIVKAALLLLRTLSITLELSTSIFNITLFVSTLQITMFASTLLVLSRW